MWEGWCTTPPPDHDDDDDEDDVEEEEEEDGDGDVSPFCPSQPFFAHANFLQQSS